MNNLFNKLQDSGVEVEETLKRLMGDEALYLEYLYKFPQNPNIVNLRNAINEKNYKTALEEVHTLKGIGLNLGLLNLVDVCMDMLLDLRSKETNNLEEILGDIELEFEKISNIIVGEQLNE